MCYVLLSDAVDCDKMLSYGGKKCSVMIQIIVMFLLC
jgi:hypothetical protein